MAEETITPGVYRTGTVDEIAGQPGEERYERALRTAKIPVPGTADAPMAAPRVESIAASYFERRQQKIDAELDELLKETPEEKAARESGEAEPPMAAPTPKPAGPHPVLNAGGKPVIGKTVAAGASAAATSVARGFDLVKEGISSLLRGVDRPSEMPTGATGAVLGAGLAGGNIVAGLFHMTVGAGFGGFMAAIDEFANSVAPETMKETLKGTGGPGGIAPLVRALMGAPSFKPGRTPEERAAADADLTVAEVLQAAVMAGLNGMPLMGSGGAAFKPGRAPIEPTPKPAPKALPPGKEQLALPPGPKELAAHGADVRPAGPSSLEGRPMPPSTLDQMVQNFSAASKAEQWIAEAGLELRGVTQEAGGEALYWTHDPQTGSTGLALAHQLSPEYLRATTEASRAEFAVHATARDLAAQLADPEQGGFTYSMKHGKVQFPAGSRAVSIAPELEKSIPGRASAADIADFIKQNREVLDDDRAALGGWYDKASDRTNLDISIATSAEEAQAVGRAAKQRAIFDPETGVSEPVVYGEGPHPYHKAAEPLRPADIEVARTYDSAKTNEALRPAWSELVTQVEKQFDELSVKVEFVDGQPYASAEQMAREVKETGVIKVSKEFNEHPFWTPEQNLKFRAVHDIKGHVEAGHDFSLRGEERAWLAHDKQVTGDGAKMALKTEVYGQAASAVANAEFAPQKAVDLGGTGLAPISERVSKGVSLKPGEKKFRPTAQPVEVAPEARAALEQTRRNDVLIQGFDESGARARVAEIIAQLKGTTGAIEPGAKLLGTREFRQLYKAAITLGAIEIHRGAKSFKDFSKVMTAATGDFIKPRLPRLYDESKRLLAQRIEETKDGLPSVRWLFELHKAGENGSTWYHGVMAELEREFGAEAPLVRKFIAATSPLQDVPRNVDLALEAYTAYKTHEGFSNISFGVATPNVRANLKRVVEWWEKGAPAGEEPLSGLKVVPFDRAMAGDVTAFVADRWIWRLFYGKEAGTPAQYDFMKAAAAREAQELGVSVRDLQAQWWVAYKTATERANRGAAAGPGRATRGTIEPLRDVIRRKLQEPAPEPYLAEVATSALSEEGKIDLGTTLVLSRAVIGAVVGASTGETPEDAFRNALIGMGLGAAASPALARRMLTGAKGAMPQVPPGVGVSPTARKAMLSRTPYQPNYNYIKADAEVKMAMASAYDIAHDNIKTGRRGVQAHADTLAMADQLITSGEVTVEKVLSRPASTEPVAAHVMTAMRQLDVGLGAYRKQVMERTLSGEAAPGELRKVTALHAAFAERVSLAKTGTARALEAMKIDAEAEALGPLTGEAIGRFADSIDPRLSDMDLAQLMDTTERAAGARGGNRLLRTISKFPDAFLEVFYGSILWGKAIGRNFFGNLTLEAGSDIVHGIGSWMPRGLPFVTPAEGWLKPGIVPGEFAAQIHGRIEGWRKMAIARGRLAAVDEAGGGKFDLALEGHKPVIGVENPQGVFGHALNYLGTGIRGATTILQKQDVWSKAHHINARIHGMAHRRATVEGLSGEAFQKRYMDLVDNPDQFSRSERAELARIVRQDTYTMDVELPPAKAMVDALGQHPWHNAAARYFVFAFPRITANMFETFASYTPGLNVLSTRFWRSMRAGGAEAQQAYGRLALGAAVYGTLLYWADEGLIAGDHPSDPDHKRTVDVGGYRLSYRGLGFLEDIFATAANTRRAIAQVPEKDLVKLTYATALSMWDAVDNMAFIQTFGQFASILEQTKRPEARVENLQVFMEKKGLSLIPFSGLLKEMRRTFDPVRRETETFSQRFMDALPGLSTLKDKEGSPLVPSYRNLLTGVPLTVQNIPFVTTAVEDQDDPVWDEVFRLSRTVASPVLRPVPDQLVPGIDPDDGMLLAPTIKNRAGFSLTHQEKDRWAVLMTQEVKLGGDLLHASLKKLIESPRYKGDRMSDARKADLIVDRYNGFMRAAKSALLRESPLLKKELMRTQSENNIQLLPPDRQPSARDALRNRIGVSP